MLDLMRKHAQSWIVKAILAIIIIVFIFYFGSMGGQTTDTLAVVDGKAISVAEFQKEYANLLEAYGKQFGAPLTEDMIKAMNLKQQVLDSLIYQSLMMRKAKDLRLEISDEELRAFIASIPAFSRNGVFDERLYQQLLRQNRMTAEDFETAQRRALTSSKMQDLIQDATFVSDQELLDFYRAQNERINCTVVRFKPQDYRKDVVPKAADLEQYLKEHAAAFRIPEQVSVKILGFPAAAFAGKAQVSDAEVEETYNRFKERAGKGQKIPSLDAARKQIAAELRMSKGLRLAYDAAKKAHDTIYQQENFDAYAATAGLPIRTTGFFSAASLPPEFSKTENFSRQVFTLQQNDVSGVLSASYGYALVKVTAKKPAATPPFKDVEGLVRQRFTDEETGRLAKQSAEKTLEALRKSGDLRRVAAERRLAVEETGLFPAAKPPAKLGNSPDLRRALFTLSDKKPFAEGVFPAEGGYMLIGLKGRSVASDADFAAVKDSLKKVLLRVKNGEALESWIEATKAAMMADGRISIKKELKDL